MQFFKNSFASGFFYAFVIRHLKNLNQWRAGPIKGAKIPFWEGEIKNPEHFFMDLILFLLFLLTLCNSEQFKILLFTFYITVIFENTVFKGLYSTVPYWPKINFF